MDRVIQQSSWFVLCPSRDCYPRLCILCELLLWPLWTSFENYIYHLYYRSKKGRGESLGEPYMTERWDRYRVVSRLWSLVQSVRRGQEVRRLESGKSVINLLSQRTTTIHTHRSDSGRPVRSGWGKSVNILLYPMYLRTCTTVTVRKFWLSLL